MSMVKREVALPKSMGSGKRLSEWNISWKRCRSRSICR
jgi:hypothetical protein